MVALFGKKEEKQDEIPKLPELPELPPLPDLEPYSPKKEENSELPPLPSFPSSLAGRSMSRVALRPSISNREEQEEEYIPEIEGPMTREIENKQVLIKPSVREIRPSIKIEPVYVRIDKYQASLANFQEIKKKVLEIGNLLREIRETKNKEEYQLVEWEREIQEAKNKLDSIDRTIFNKLEE